MGVSEIIHLWQDRIKHQRLVCLMLLTDGCHIMISEQKLSGLLGLHKHLSEVPMPNSGVLVTTQELKL